VCGLSGRGAGNGRGTLGQESSRARRATLAQFLDLLPPPGRLTLDAGCGEGRLGRVLAAVFGPHRAVWVSLCHFLTGYIRTCAAQRDPKNTTRPKGHASRDPAIPASHSRTGSCPDAAGRGGSRDRHAPRGESTTSVIRLSNRMVLTQVEQRIQSRRWPGRPRPRPRPRGQEVPPGGCSGPRCDRQLTSSRQRWLPDQQACAVRSVPVREAPWKRRYVFVTCEVHVSPVASNIF
jgi:hypothetical protein